MVVILSNSKQTITITDPLNLLLLAQMGIFAMGKLKTQRNFLILSTNFIHFLIYSVFSHALILRMANEFKFIKTWTDSTHIPCIAIISLLPMLISIVFVLMKYRTVELVSVVHEIKVVAQRQVAVIRKVKRENPKSYEFAFDCASRFIFPVLGMLFWCKYMEL